MFWFLSSYPSSIASQRFRIIPFIVQVHQGKPHIVIFGSHATQDYCNLLEFIRIRFIYSTTSRYRTMVKKKNQQNSLKLINGIFQSVTHRDAVQVYPLNKNQNTKFASYGLS